MLVMTSVLPPSGLRRRREPRSIKMAAYFLQIETRIRYAAERRCGPGLEVRGSYDSVYKLMYKWDCVCGPC